MHRGPAKSHMTTTSRLLLSVVVLALLMTGCATKREQHEVMRASLVAYEKALRWGNFDAAIGMHRVEGGVQTGGDNLSQIRVTRYEALNQKLNEDRTELRQTVIIKYYNTETLREKSIQTSQHWKLDKDSKRWHLLSDFPRFP